MVRLSKAFVRVRIDCTDPAITDPESFKASPAVKPHVDRFGVTGWPTVLFTDSHGRELERMGWRSVEAVSAQMERVLERWKRLDAAEAWIDARFDELRDGSADERRRAADDLRAIDERIRRALEAAPRQPPNKGR